MKFELMDTEDNQQEEERNMEGLELARRNFALWNEALQTKDPGKVTALFAEDGTLLPTLSNQLRKGWDEIRDYFEHHFLPKNPKGEVRTEDFRQMGQDHYLYDGLYDFEVDGNNGQRTIVKARYTFNYQRTKKGAWEIIHLHSSKNPEA